MYLTEVAGSISGSVAEAGTACWSRLMLRETGEDPGKENCFFCIAACVGKDQRNHNEAVSFFFLFFFLFKEHFRRMIQLNSCLLKICRWLVKCN